MTVNCEYCGKECKNERGMTIHQRAMGCGKREVQNDNDNNIPNNNPDDNDNNIPNNNPDDNDNNIPINNKKQNLGQFYTTNYTYILQNLTIPDYVQEIVEPFAGNGDLLEFMNDIPVKCYDIDPQKENIKRRDTLLSPPNIINKFVITNPPYLARNKSKDKQIFNKYEQNDLYKCFIKILIENQCQGGVLIIPVNFWSSIRNGDINLRKEFLSKYNVEILNIFEEQVFDDTAYTVCSFLFTAKNDVLPNIIKCNIFPNGLSIDINLNKDNGFIIGGEIYKLEYDNNIYTERLTKNNKQQQGITNIIVNCIDSNTKNKIRMIYVSKEQRYIDKTTNLSSRSHMTPIILPELTEEQQKELVEKFNSFLEDKREKYHSLFLTNFRESSDLARKRISFKLVFDIIKHIITKMNNM